MKYQDIHSKYYVLKTFLIVQNDFKSNPTIPYMKTKNHYSIITPSISKLVLSCGNLSSDVIEIIFILYIIFKKKHQKENYKMYKRQSAKYQKSMREGSKNSPCVCQLHHHYTPIVFYCMGHRVFIQFQ